MVLYSSPIQDYVHLDDQTQPTIDMTPGFKSFTDLCSYSSKVLNQNQGLKKVHLLDFLAGQLIFKLTCPTGKGPGEHPPTKSLTKTSKEPNPININTEGTTESVGINGASVLSGSCY